MLCIANGILVYTFREILSINTVYTLFLIISVCLGIMFLNPFISQQLAKNKTIQRWFINQQAKKWRKGNV